MSSFPYIVELDASQVDIANDLLKMGVNVGLLVLMNMFFAVRFKQSLVSNPITFIALVNVMSLFVSHFGLDRVIRVVPKMTQESAYFVARRRAP